MDFEDGIVKRSSSSKSIAKAWDKISDVVIGWLCDLDDSIAKTVLC